ncbi:MAG: hypothetical protein L3J39_15335 [Verrucomicrobiales bacterium]|nr:hypothetical protein [Verrucomicrobiales bacterium]
MRVTVEIEDHMMEQVIEETCEKKKSPALAMALGEFLQNRKKQKFLRRILSGATDYAASNDEVEEKAALER